MEEALYDVPLYREFAGPAEGMTRLPDESAILRFRHLLEAHGLAIQMLALVNDILGEKGLMLKAGSAVDATPMSAPTSTKNGTGTRDPEMHQTKKGNQWFFGIKVHVGVDAQSGLVHAVVGTAANVHDPNAAAALLMARRPMCMAMPATRVSRSAVQVAQRTGMRLGRRRRLNPRDSLDAINARVERLKTSIRVIMEHPYRVLKQQFGYTKTRHRGLRKNTAQITTLFARGNLWMARKALLKA